MANYRFKAASIYIGQKKVGQIGENKLSIHSGDEPQIGDPGFLGYSDGATLTTMTCNAVIPTTGMDVDLIGVILNKQDVDILFGPIGTSVLAITMRLTQAEGTSSHKDGSLKGDFTFGGGPPKQITT